MLFAGHCAAAVAHVEATDTEDWSVNQNKGKWVVDLESFTSL